MREVDQYLIKLINLREGSLLKDVSYEIKNCKNNINKLEVSKTESYTNYDNFSLEDDIDPKQLMEFVKLDSKYKYSYSTSFSEDDDECQGNFSVCISRKSETYPDEQEIDNISKLQFTEEKEINRLRNLAKNATENGIRNFVKDLEEQSRKIMEVRNIFASINNNLNDDEVIAIVNKIKMKSIGVL